MKPWTTAADVRQKVQREWDKGNLARAVWPGGGLEFPFRVALRGPGSDEWSDRFDEARAWITSLEGLPLDWREFQHPRLGRNRVPTAAVWDDAEGLLGFLGRKKDARRYQTLAETISRRFPGLAAWVADHPHVVLEADADWEPVLAFLDWRAAHPRPLVYLRQVDLPGVHTKFLEARRGLLTTLLDQVLEPGSFDAAQTGAGRFAERYSFLPKPRFVRFRHLDPGHSGPPGPELAARRLGPMGVRPAPYFHYGERNQLPGLLRPTRRAGGLRRRVRV